MIQLVLQVQARVYGLKFFNSVQHISTSAHQHISTSGDVFYGEVVFPVA